MTIKDMYIEAEKALMYGQGEKALWYLHRANTLILLDYDLLADAERVSEKAGI